MKKGDRVQLSAEGLNHYRSDDWCTKSLRGEVFGFYRDIYISVTRDGRTTPSVYKTISWELEKVSA